MKTIPEILDLAIGSLDNLPEAILHSKVLADGVGNPTFKDWVDKELSGYPTYPEVPDYRRVRGRLEGDYEKYLVSTQRDAVPPQILGPELYDLVSTTTFNQSVSILANSPDDGSLAWSVGMEEELLSLINPDFGSHGRFVRLWNRLQPGSIRGVQLEIQNRLVSLLSEMNQFFPSVAEADSPSPRQFAQVGNSVGRILQVNNASSVLINPVSVSFDHSQHQIQQINVGNWRQFSDFLTKEKIPEDRQRELKELLDKVEEGDASDSTEKRFKELVENTAKEMAGSVSDSLKDETTKAATKLIIEKAKEYAPHLIKFGWVAATIMF